MNSTDAKESRVRLLHAVWDNNLGAVQAELDSGITADGPALHAAASHGFDEIVAALLAAGANPYVMDLMPPVAAAALNGHAVSMKLLLEAAPGFCLDLTLCYAAMNNHADCIEILFAAGADVMANKCQALSWAMVHGARDSIRALLSAGASFNIGAQSAQDFAADSRPFTSEESSARMTVLHRRISEAREIAKEIEPALAGSSLCASAA